MAHTFGGDWTEDKLEVVRRYFDANAKAQKNQHFAKWYVDAFAGTGERTGVVRSARGVAPLFGDDAGEVNEVKEGSVRIALGIEPPFDRYILIDLDKGHVVALEALRQEFPTRTIDIRTGDANEVLEELCRSTHWRNTRAAIFVDPYGMQVNWSTLEALAATKAVDIALLFPTGPLNRMLTRHGNIPAEWAKRIDDHLGPCDWRTEFYKEVEIEQIDLFSPENSGPQKTMNVDGLRLFVLNRLKSIFAFVGDEQLELKNSRGAVLYHLFIICANPSSAAVNLANRLARSAVRLPRGRKR